MAKKLVGTKYSFGQKVAIYIRVSTVHQVDKDSLLVQRRELIAYCKLILNIEDYEVFEDAGFSGKNTDRPNYQAMMERVRKGEFSHILVWKIDRVSRNLLDFASMYSEIRNIGVTFISKNEQFDTSTAIGEAMLKIILVFAELERNMTSERVTSVMLSRAENGQWNGGRVPYGYSLDKATKTFSFNPSEIEQARAIFDLYIKGNSAVQIADKFNESRVPTRYEKKWSPATIHRILTNPWYYGTYRYNIRQGTNGPKRDEDNWLHIDNHHDGIISKDKFDEIQYRLKKNKRGGNQKGISVTKIYTHVFAGIMKCSCCGCMLTSTPGKIRADGWRPSVYACHNRRKGKMGCESKFVTDVTLLPFIFSFLSNIIKVANAHPAKLTDDKLQKLLLKGYCFSNVQSISSDSIKDLKDMILDNSFPNPYTPQKEVVEKQSSSNEKASLLEQRKKLEKAQLRLKQLYLYGDAEIKGFDFVAEQNKLADSIKEIDERLDEILEAEDDLLLSEEDFNRKASYLIMVDSLLNTTLEDTAVFLRELDNSVLKTFVQTVIKSILIDDGNVASITLKNGVVCNFNYK